MIKKIRCFYLSFLLFCLCFFSIYSLRLYVYDFIHDTYGYSDTLNKDEIKKIKKYLKKAKQEKLTLTQKSIDLNALITKGSYQLVWRDVDKSGNVKDSWISFNGQVPSKHIQKYKIIISIEKHSFVEWMPLFEHYYFYYRIFDFLVSIFLIVLFNKYIHHSKLYLFIRNHLQLKTYYSLSSKMAMTFLISTCFVFGSFAFLYYHRSSVFEFVMDTFYQSENYDDCAHHIMEEVREIDFTKDNKNQIQQVIKKYVPHHAMVYIYDQDGVYFTGKTAPLLKQNSIVGDHDQEDIMDTPLYYTYALSLKEQHATLIITSFPLMEYFIPYLIVILFISFSFYFMSFQEFIKKRMNAIQNLQKDVFCLAQGDWQHEVSIDDLDEIGLLAQELNTMRKAFLLSQENEQVAKKANRELISSLSHDLRTPLTTLKGYLEIVQLEKESEEKRKEYLQRCLNKVEEISDLSNKMFEYTLVFSTEDQIKLEPLSTESIQMMIQDHIQYLRELDLHVNECLWDKEHFIYGNTMLIQRILNNIFSNIQKYCDPWQDIIVQTFVEKESYKMCFTNTINQKLDKVESNGIGLKGVEKMVKMQKGTFYKKDVNDLFIIVITIPLHKSYSQKSE